MDETTILIQAGFAGAFYLMYLMVTTTLKENTNTLQGVQLVLQKLCDNLNPKRD